MYRWIHTSDKALRRSSPIILRMFVLRCCKTKFALFFYLGFLSQIFTIHRTAGEVGGYFFISFLPLPLASQTFRHWPSYRCREPTSVQSWQLNSNREPTNTPRVFHAETTWKQTFPHHFNVEYTWSVCREHLVS